GADTCSSDETNQRGIGRFLPLAPDRDWSLRRSERLRAAAHLIQRVESLLLAEPAKAWAARTTEARQFRPETAFPCPQFRTSRLGPWWPLCTHRAGGQR